MVARGFDFLQLNKKDAISRTGLVTHLYSGHGVYRNMLRKPKLMRGKIYYRLHTDKGVRWVNIAPILKEEFGVEIKDVEFMFKQILQCVEKHNQFVKESIEAKQNSQIKESFTQETLANQALVEYEKWAQGNLAFPEEDIFFGY